MLRRPAQGARLLGCVEPIFSPPWFEPVLPAPFVALPLDGVEPPARPPGELGAPSAAGDIGAAPLTTDAKAPGLDGTMCKSTGSAPTATVIGPDPLTRA